MFVRSSGYIYFSRYCDNGRARVSTGIKVNKDTKSIDIDILKKSDQLALARTKDAVEKFVETKKILQEKILKEDVEEVVNRVLDKNKGAKKSFVGDWEQMMLDMSAGKMLKPRTQGRYSEATVTAYKQSLRYLTEYAEKHKIELTYNINTAWVKGLIVYLTANNFSKNTIAGIIGNIKSFLSHMNRAGKHKNDIYKEDIFNVSKEEADTIALSVEEITKIYRMDLSVQQGKARDVFVFACWVGLRKRDLVNINRYVLRGNVFDILTHKTSERVVIPVHWMAREIHEKYAGNMPIYGQSNVLNDHIKSICQKAGITSMELVTMTKGGRKEGKYYERCELASIHTARRSFATNAYKAGIKPLEIMKITGHKTESAFMKYIRIDKEENAQNLAEHPFFKK